MISLESKSTRIINNELCTPVVYKKERLFPDSSIVFYYPQGKKMSLFMWRSVFTAVHKKHLRNCAVDNFNDINKYLNK